MTLIQTKSLPKGKGFFLLRWKEKQHQCSIKHQRRFTRLIFISVQNDIQIFFCKVLHFFCVAVNAKEYKIFIPVLLIPIYFFRLFKQVIIHINIKRFFGIFTFAEDDIIGIICCDNINFCIFSVSPLADFCGSETESVFNNQLRKILIFANVLIHIKKPSFTLNNKLAT